MTRSPCAEFGNGGATPGSCLRGPFFGVSFLMCARTGLKAGAASTAGQQLSGMLKYTTGLEFGEDAQS